RERAWGRKPTVSFAPGSTFRGSYRRLVVSADDGVADLSRMTSSLVCEHEHCSEKPRPLAVRNGSRVNRPPATLSKQSSLNLHSWQLSVRLARPCAKSLRSSV